MQWSSSKIIIGLKSEAVGEGPWRETEKRVSTCEGHKQIVELVFASLVPNVTYSFKTVLDIIKTVLTGFLSLVRKHNNFKPLPSFLFSYFDLDASSSFLQQSPQPRQLIANSNLKLWREIVQKVWLQKLKGQFQSKKKKKFRSKVAIFSLQRRALINFWWVQVNKKIIQTDKLVCAHDIWSSCAL